MNKLRGEIIKIDWGTKAWLQDDGKIQDGNTWGNLPAVDPEQEHPRGSGNSIARNRHNKPK